MNASFCVIYRVANSSVGKFLEMLWVDPEEGRVWQGGASVDYNAINTTFQSGCFLLTSPEIVLLPGDLESPSGGWKA